ncbi:hypothetical protein SAMN04487786_2546 [Paenisporosarcina quisquiliarum]|uniref:Uncharacterized protein n=1 Tax=Psychrobacillus psychrodurans TaxID=126157 RepID=A0A9X3RB48_9BACI|nr:hypothetical protein [Psychrobacillus psychrodurans]MCZ8535259.1 hypothetical protein [Psychrobacillus psychrodurans]SEM76571.1 hypothetical protein SAMN04487786_2546 [Paenisporosarcina quisquiliarum]
MEISITKALRELKTLDARILKKINETTFAASKKPKENIRGFKTVEAFEKEAKESIQSIKDLMDRRKQIKKSIVESNARTVVEVSGVKMTVADAIERKNFIEIEKTLLRKMNTDYAQSQEKVEVNNEIAQDRLDTQLNNMISKDGKTDLTAVEGYKKLFWESEETKLIDPIHVKEIATKMALDIESFEDDVDVALSEINARTLITIKQ